MGHQRITNAGGPVTRIGRLSLAGEVVDAEPVMPRRIRVLDEFVLSVVTGGRGRYRGEGPESGRPITPGSLTLTVPGQPHWYGTAHGERWTECFAVFRGGLFDALRDAGVLTGIGPRRLAPEASASVSTLALLLQARPTGHRAAEHQLLQLADWLVGACSSAAGPESPLDRAAARLTEDFQEKLGGAEVAVEVGMTYDAFRRQFVAVFGQAPQAYRNTRRGEAAASLLRLTAMTHHEIARRLGFADEFHFSHAFRRQFGVSPSAYRHPGPDQGDGAGPEDAAGPGDGADASSSPAS